MGRRRPQPPSRAGGASGRRFSCTVDLGLANESDLFWQEDLQAGRLNFLKTGIVYADRITTVSYGKEKPIDPGTGEEADAKNRNGHTAITDGARPG